LGGVKKKKKRSNSRRFAPARKVFVQRARKLGEKSFSEIFWEIEQERIAIVSLQKIPLILLNFLLLE
jgi:hypothetical protein